MARLKEIYFVVDDPTVVSEIRQVISKSAEGAGTSNSPSAFSGQKNSSGRNPGSSVTSQSGGQPTSHSTRLHPYNASTSASYSATGPSASANLYDYNFDDRHGGDINSSRLRREQSGFTPLDSFAGGHGATGVGGFSYPTGSGDAVSVSGSRYGSSGGHGSQRGAYGAQRSGPFSYPSSSSSGILYPSTSASSVTSGRPGGSDSKYQMPGASAATSTAASFSATSSSSAAATSSAASSSSAAASSSKDHECAVCMDSFTNPQKLPCGHEFCKDCLDQVVKTAKSHLCPTCRTPFKSAEGKQPRGGRMTTQTSHGPLPGYTRCGCITITYDIPSGMQGPEHPSPGQYYTGTSRTAYLPDNAEGRRVEKLLRKAFDQRLVFTVGQSVTTGRDNCVVWNDIHHKTSIHGGPSGYGYPDPDYLNRVIEDLRAKGITD